MFKKVITIVSSGLICAFFYLTATFAGIFNEYEHGDRTPAFTYEEDRIISGHEGQAETLSFRLSLYGEEEVRLPLLVQVHEWGGSFQRMEDIARYTPEEYDFVMLYFQYKPSTGNEDDWWFGTHWSGECRLWAHEAVMNIVREAQNTPLVSDHVPGTSIDPSRIYLFGHSIGGTGAWQLGMRNPDIFAAVHAHSGFARFTPPVGPFQQQFEDDIVGGPADGIIITGDDGSEYPARDYSNLAWWLENYRSPSFPAPFMIITAGLDDEIVPAASGADLMAPVLDAQKRCFFYYRHQWGHSEACFVQLNRMWNFRLSRSFPAFTNRSGYGVALNEIGNINDLYQFSWNPDTIVDLPNRYEVQLTGTGTADVTLRNLQNFQVEPYASYEYRLDDPSAPPMPITADQFGLLTVPSVSGPRRLIITPAGYDSIIIHLTLNQSVYTAGDSFVLSCSSYNPGPEKEAHRYIILDYHGAYWFYPAWSQSPDHQTVTLPQNENLSDQILNFTWPSNAGANTGIIFWGGYVDPLSGNLTSNIEQVYFDYQ